ncbi:unnamed protein product [Symbiodinium pilosum]|uniref:Uncharacterized protein n=1 Tax=Symbiodinium pilosum TaxID=2952 RepID=A0A812UFF1_SYMPI|nr:unnamed protein product [Symbiodinium pilosum]
MESSDLAAEDAAILATPRPNNRAAAKGIDLVEPGIDPGHQYLSLPVDPSVNFVGTVVERSAVLASKQDHRVDLMESLSLDIRLALLGPGD